MHVICKILVFFVACNSIQTITGDGRDWWRHTAIYEVYIRSFMDSNGDGVGDLKGIIMKLDHFVDLGIETIWISPFFKSPMLDLGYDVSDYTDIDPAYGTMADFDELMVEMKKRGLRLIIDFVINHSSDLHPWFEKSVNQVKPYTDYYVWKDPKGYDKDGKPMPPNNWLSLFGGCGWEWNEKRKQFYLHQFATKQPDLNLRNPALKSELKNILKFWFDKGVSGARLDATKHFFEDSKLRDEPLLDPHTDKKVLQYGDYDHIYTTDLKEIYEFIHEMRTFVDKECSTDLEEKILVAEAYTDWDYTMMYYGTKDYKVSHFPFNFHLLRLRIIPRPTELNEIIERWVHKIPSIGAPNWVTENHDNFRTANLLGLEFLDILLVTTMTLPGVVCIYYGQEIGMSDGVVRPERIRDPNNDGMNVLQTRDFERLPMQWDNSLNAGFSTNSQPWLPVNPDYWKVNVKAQKDDPNSRYNMVKTLSKLRQTKTLKYGDFTSYILSSWVYAFTRSLPGKPPIITILNLSTEVEMIHLHHRIPNLPPFTKVVAASINAGYHPGDKILTNPLFPRAVILRPLSAIVVTL